MDKSTIIKNVKEMLQDIVLENDVSLFDVEYVKEGKNYYLRVFIEKDDGISIDDCTNVSRALEKKLDEKDLIQTAYTLEVSSVGIDRPLRTDEDYSKYAGKIIDIKLYKSKSGEKTFQGELKGLIDGKIIIITEKGEELLFEKSEVATAKLAVIF